MTATSEKGPAANTSTTFMRSGAPPVLRFAPSPNGALHLGHALSALTNVHFARRLGGRLLLRIEDIDLGRTRETYVEGILRDLAWLGVTWEEPVRRQSAHFADYRAAAAKLEAMGLLYPCFATRAEIQAALIDHPDSTDPDGAPLYPGLHRGLSETEIEARRQRGEVPAMRLDMAKAVTAMRRLLPPIDAPGYLAMGADLGVRRLPAHPERWGDVIIQRKDVTTSYHLSVVVDDALQGITHVVRGLDLLAATDLHRLLQILLGLSEPIYHHHPLISGPDGRKLAKSRGDTSLAILRAAGRSPDDIRRLIGLVVATAPD